jgi:hypothetical protein
VRVAKPIHDHNSKLPRASHHVIISPLGFSYFREAAGQDYPEAMNRMWTRPITQSSLLRVAKDAARLAGRTDCRIRDGGAAVTAPAATPPPPSNETVEHRLFRVVLEIAQIFGQGEVTAVTSAIQGVTKAKSNPDMALVVGDLIMACGGDSSPTVRVLKVSAEKAPIAASHSLHTQLQYIATC